MRLVQHFAHPPAGADANGLVDAVAHRWSGGRWLSTGGGGYGVYAVVPRSWSLVWLAGAHREVPDRLPEAWRERWAAEAARYGTASLPTTFVDAPNAGEPPSRSQERRLCCRPSETVRRYRPR